VDEQTGNSCQSATTAEKLAAQHHVSERSIRNDAAFAEGVDRIAEECGPEARRQILSGEASLSRQDVVELSGKPPEEQRQALQEAAQAGRKRKASGSGKRKAKTTVPSQPGARRKSKTKEAAEDTQTPAATGEPAAATAGELPATVTITLHREIEGFGAALAQALLRYWNNDEVYDVCLAVMDFVDEKITAESEARTKKKQRD